MSSTQQLLLAEGAGGAAPNYIEDVFSTWLYAGDGTSTKTITNGLDLSTKGGMVWLKCRNNAYNNYLFDTNRGATKYLFSNATNAEATSATSLKSFTTTGFTLGSLTNINSGSYNFSSWSFRKQPKFFDVVTYTGNGASTQTISHNLGSTPGCIMVKKTSASSSLGWSVYHRGLTTGSYLLLNTTAGQAADSFMDGANAPTSTTFTAQLATSDGLNANGATYVAYLFAHNAGGFGTSGTDNVISCGSYTGNGGTTTVTLGYEPQWILVRAVNNGYDWAVYDNMRGMPNRAGNLSNSIRLVPNTSDAEAGNCTLYPTATGFTIDDGSGSVNGSGINYIYIAIRRGPMKAPTDATKLYLGQWTQDTSTIITTDFPVDLAIDRWQYLTDTQAAVTGSFYVYDRLRGSPQNLITTSTALETSSQPSFYVATTGFQSNTELGIGPGNGTLSNYYANFWLFRRAPSFLDVVCYTGTGAATTFNHNLGVVPELMIVKRRTGSTGAWLVYSSALTNAEELVLNQTAAKTSSTNWNSTTPTSSVFSVGANAVNNASGSTYVAYLFATCPGVSKVGTYTGTGATQTINCGFAGGARWVMIKRTDTTGNWCQWDTARGMVSGNDKKLLVNTTAATTNADWVYTATTGFQIVTNNTDVNASGGTYIYLAIA
jgi:hypothetical protein